MIVEILKTNPHIESWQALMAGEHNGKTIFEITKEEYDHFEENHSYYKIKSKKLFFDEAYKNTVEAQKEAGIKATSILTTKLELCNYKEHKEKFEKFKIPTVEVDNKIAELEYHLRELEGENAV